MPVVSRPKDAAPLFGGQTRIMIGGGLAQQLREWQKKRKPASPTTDEED